jgi:plasmid maintenance system antidote protein VapI
MLSYERRATREGHVMTVKESLEKPVATKPTALRLGIFFGMAPRFWLNLQSEYDMRVADRELRAKLAPRIRVLQPGAS